MPRSLATIPGDRNAKAVQLRANHINMVKFGAEDDEYSRVLLYLTEAVKEAPPKVKDNWIPELDCKRM